MNISSYVYLAEYDPAQERDIAKICVTLTVTISYVRPTDASEILHPIERRERACVIQERADYSCFIIKLYENFITENTISSQHNLHEIKYYNPRELNNKWTVKGMKGYDIVIISAIDMAAEFCGHYAQCS